MNQQLQAVILAAGESSRFWPLNARHKSLLRVMGKPLIWYTIDGLKKIGVKEIIIAQSPKRDVEEELKKFSDLSDLKYVIQPEANGMSGAIIAVKDLIKSQFFVVFAHAIDCQNIARLMLDKSKETGAKMVLAGQPTKNPWLYGVARMEADRLFEVMEKPEQGKESSNIKINGIYLFDKQYFDSLQKVLGTVHFNKEFEVGISEYAKNNDARIVVLDENYKGISLKYPWHLFKVQKYLFDKYLTKKTIAKSAQIAKNAIIEGNVFIGENVKVYEGAIIKNNCYIADNSIIGNNSIVRDGCDLEAGSLVGALCEITRTIFQPDVHIHSGFFGDSILDRGVRVGAGAITANVRTDRQEIFAYVLKEKNGIKAMDKISAGTKSLGTIIGQNAKISCRATFMPARFIGQNCFVSPATIITRNLANNSQI